MSTNSVNRRDEIQQLKQLVQDALQQRGLISKLKAELRLGVVEILNNQKLEQ